MPTTRTLLLQLQVRAAVVAARTIQLPQLLPAGSRAAGTVADGGCWHWVCVAQQRSRPLWPPLPPGPLLLRCRCLWPLLTRLLMSVRMARLPLRRRRARVCSRTARFQLCGAARQAPLLALPRRTWRHFRDWMSPTAPTSCYH
jgi:hypothetical protein